MKRFLLYLFFIAPVSAFAQPITGLNFREWYNPDAEIAVTFNLVRLSDRVVVDYTIDARQQPLSKYSIVWERRDTYTQREGTALTETHTSIAETEKQKQGSWIFPSSAASWLLVARVTNTESKTTWTYFRQIDPKYPQIGWLEKDGRKVNSKFITLKNPYPVKMAGEAPVFVSVYFNDFNAATPPFAEQVDRADRFMFYDSTFRLASDDTFVPQKPGVYLFQRDTNAAEGFAFLGVSDIYPKFSSITDLAQPLLYVTTSEEYNEIALAGNDKAKFDKVILDITNDRERAKTFMRSYFRRVELANIYFTSYKQGWKTDRGMTYLIFGLPDEISMNDGTETWFYKSSRTRFTFVKRGSVYDPDHYVLLRDKRFAETWFSTIDLWRKSRF
ncbi:MAG: GWxTD domain-containing protein [Cyclobacteriaceae bacterium]|nr:GWxTD domain-containing protein [Cyclobacteriaceae bacterium]